MSCEPTGSSAARPRFRNNVARTVSESTLNRMSSVSSAPPPRDAVEGRLALTEASDLEGAVEPPLEVALEVGCDPGPAVVDVVSRRRRRSSYSLVKWIEDGST